MSQKRNPGFLLKAQTGISGFQRDAKGENQVLTGYRGGRKENGQARLSTLFFFISHLPFVPIKKRLCPLGFHPVSVYRVGRIEHNRNAPEK